MFRVLGVYPGSSPQTGAEKRPVSDVVLDASALLALLQDEPGADVVASHLHKALMCTVNHSEVVAKLADTGMPEPAIREALNLPLRLVEFNEALSVRAGMLRPTTRTLGLSLGDRACLALALERGAAALTAETAWADVPDGPDLELIRTPAREKSGQPTRTRNTPKRKR